MAEFIDLRGYEGPPAIDCDICIAGAGAAGITLARELASSGKSIVLLESGGFDMQGATQLLYSGTNTGMRYFDLAACRLRYFGGTTNHWGGMTQCPSRLDLEGMPSIGLPAWQLTHEALSPYMQRAAEALDLDFDLFDAARAARAQGVGSEALIERRSSLLSTIAYQPAPRRRFAEEFRADLKSTPALRLFLHANLTHIQLREDGTRVAHFTVKTLDGRTITVHAREYVLACHAIENARLLLASNDVQTKGIGNQSDQVGRNFMDHVYLRSGRLLTDGDTIPDCYWRKLHQRGDAVPAKRPDFVVALADRVRREEQLLSYYLNFQVVYADEGVYKSLAHLKESFFSPFDNETLNALGHMVTDLSSAARIAQEEIGLRRRKVAFLQLYQRIDQAPNPASRVTLTHDRDALGLPKVNLHWDVTDLDIRSLQRGQELAARELSALGMGRFVLEPITADHVRENLIGHYHHLGTTSMSSTPRNGVVNGDCKVHDVQNLYVAGSSTFPTGGSVGPTLTIVAMAARLADHLKRKTS